MGFLDAVKAFFTNYLLVSAIVAWITAQIFKIFTGVYKDRRINLTLLLFSTGGMPSSHSATVCATATCCAYVEGFHSTSFAIACVFAFVVMYDAMGVRRAVGEQAKVLNEIIFDIANNKPFAFENGLKEIMGHTPLQVFFGMLLGILVGWVFPWLCNTPPYYAA